MFCWVCAIAAMPAIAQISSDGTLSTTVTTPDSLNFTIDNGNRAGNNLFHSFSQFSIPTNGSASFNNAADITNIFGRVTGGGISNIDGLIQATGNANVFLLNPSGIIFGPNARLNIGGSFFGTTAASVRFADGVEFSATNASGTPLLSVSAPIGLQMSSNPAPIRVQGTGHNLTLDTSVTAFPPFTRETNPAALSVKPGRTLALVGGNIEINGGQLVADGGRIELGSVGGGQVSLSAIASGFALSYGSVSNFQDILLDEKALVDASGSDSNGGIYIAGRQVRFLDASAALIQNSPTSQGGKIAIAASELLEFTGTSADGQFRSNATTETTTAQPSGDIEVTTRDLIFREGGQLVTRTFAAGNAGRMSINASESVQFLGISSINFRFPSNIFATSSGSATGNAGDVDLATKRLLVTDGAVLSNASFSRGAAGTFRIDAESVEISGVDPVFQTPSDLRVGSFRGGDGGSLTLNAQRVTVRDGGRINGSTVGRGSAGTLTINASQFVDIDGGRITSSATVPDARVILITGLDPNNSTGRAGGININTNRLIVRNQGEVTVQNNGPTNGGNLRINAGSVLLDGEGLLSAETKLGEGGNIDLQVRDALVMRRGSTISATAGGGGNGGNIRINAQALIALENSDIIANAFQGSGGNIQISTRNIFGTAFRLQLTPESDITASSQFGVNGVVEINNLDVDPASESAQLPEEVSDPSQKIASGCAVARENHFIVTGRGGLPPNPSQGLRSDRTWSDVRDLSAFWSSERVEAEAKPASSADLTEATGWVVSETGQVELIAAVPNSPNQGAIARSVNCRGTVSQLQF
ncbi:MAG: S-layer family protein [Cyanobacteriota bacterium]|nr:S-layer family protein [Cyanobacteriota bacterium]